MTSSSPYADGGGLAGVERLGVGSAMSEAAAWRDGLDEEQRAVGVWEWLEGSAEAERRRWFYTPTDHGGLTMHQMAPAQQRRDATVGHRSDPRRVRDGVVDHGSISRSPQRRGAAFGGQPVGSAAAERPETISSSRAGP